MMKCLSCGCEKDPTLLEAYPYDGDEFDHYDLLPSLLTIECQRSTEWGMAILCHECWHKLSRACNGVDMWIDCAVWKSLDPVTAYENLPAIKKHNSKTIWDAKHYAT